MHAAYSFPNDGGDDFNDADDAQNTRAPPLANPKQIFSKCDADDEEIFKKIWTTDEGGRPTFQNFREDMSKHSTLPYLDEGRLAAKRLDWVGNLPHKPTFVNQGRASTCCAVGRNTNCQQCLVVCANCDGGKPGFENKNCKFCPLALPISQPSEQCPCGVNFLWIKVTSLFVH